MTNLKRFLTLFLVVFLAVNVWGGDVSVNIGDYATAHSWTSGGGGPYTSVTIDANVTATVSGGGNTGKYYTDWRLYQSESATITITTTSGTLSSVTFTYSTSNGGVLKDGSTNVNTGAARSISGTSKTFSVGNTGTKTNGQVRITAISVTYTPAASCSNKVTISKGTESHGSFNLNKTGAQETCSGLTVTVTDISPSSGWQFDHIEQTGVAAGDVTIDNAAKTVTYVADVTGASSITAVFTEEASETFDLVTDASDLSVGDEIIILEEDGDVAISTTQNTNNRGETSNFTLSGTTVTVPSSSNVEVFTLGTSTHTDDHWTLHASGTEGYLYAANSSNNHLKTRASNDDGNSEWAISISSDIASIIAQGSYTHNVMQYNSGSSIFACYGSANQTDLKIYRKSTTDPTITAPSSITGFTYNYGEGPDTKTMEVSGKNLTGNLTVELEDGDYLLSLNNSDWSTSLTLTATAGVVSSTTVYVRLVSGLSVGTHNGSISVSGGGATTKNVTLEGAVTLVCTTPTLTFGGTSSVSKVLGSDKFTIAASSPNNTLDAAITYSSSNTSKATVDENTGEVTLVQATGSGSPVTITATLAAKNTGVACQDEVTTSYTLTIYNKVTWMVGEDEYTGGSPTTQVLQGAQITSFPTDPNGDALCGGKVFIGWTDHEIADPVDASPTPMYKVLSDLSSVYINANKTFYAVFAAASSGAGSGNYLLVETDPGATNWAGDYLIAYDATTFADGRLGGETGMGAQYASVSPGDNLSGKVVTGSWGDTYNVTITKKTGSTNTYLLQTKDGKYNYQTSNNNGLASTATKSTAEGYPLTITFYSASDIEITVPAGPVFHYNPADYFRFYKNGGQENVYLYKKDGGGTTYSDYSTTCGTCLPAPTAPTVTPKSNRATITWAAVPDATGYTVTCTGGSVSVVGTTATITGLTAETSYDFTIRSQGSDPYSCFPAYHGSFTTTSCEDSPVLGTVAVTPTTAAISWTCEAATATVRVYEDAECNTQVGTDHTLCTSPYTVTSLTSNTTYYYKVYAGGTCVSPVGSFTTEEIKLDIAEWQTDAVVVSFNGDADLTLTTFTEETHGDPHANVADDIFFSKYFEAAANVKLLAIFNGTLSTVNLSNYKLGLAQAGKGTSVTEAFAFKKFSEIIKKSGEHLTADELELQSNEELILITYTAKDEDDQIVSCARSDEEHSKFSTYIRISSPELQFNGDDAIMLLNPDGDPIDLIGAGTKTGGLTREGASFQYISSGYNHNDFMDQPGGWYTTAGYQANSDNTETSGYALSTNRCLLIRRKFVKSGHAAVALNTTDFVTLSAYSYDSDDDGTPENYEAEWKGVQIPGSTTVYPYAAMSNSCTGFAVVGGYNYNDYYVDFDPVGSATTFDDLKSSPFDGTYVIPVTDLYDKACTQVRIELRDGSDNLVIRKDVKVPIMITGTKNTTDDIFHTHYKDAAICRACDVVVLNGGTLTKAADGTTNDIDEVRDLKIYPGGKFVIPEDEGSNEYNYTVNSLAFRRQEDDVATADIQGGLGINKTDAVYLDVRIDPTNWHYFTLPYDCNVSDITFSTGDPATLGTDYLIQWYDGAYRAEHKTGGWTDVSPSATLKKGLGYIVALPGDGIIKKEIRFPMSNAVIADESTNKTVSSVYGYGADDPELRPNHKGWNLLGNPYFMEYSSNIENPLRTGLLEEDHSTNPWDGQWKENGDGLYYIVEPIDNGWSGYRQETMAGYAMKPFTCYFVQIGAPTTAQSILFEYGQTGRPTLAPRRMEAEEEDNHPVWFGLTMTAPNSEKDNTALLISNQFTDDYDMMKDLVKMRGSYYTYYNMPVLASRNISEELAFNALPDASAEAGVPLNYYAAAAGTYTFAYNPRYSTDEIKSAMLYDATTAQYYDLLAEPYSFTTAKGDNKTRFTLFVRVERKKQQTPTGLEDIGYSETPRKILIDGHVYIQRGNALYDVTGKQMLNR